MDDLISRQAAIHLLEEMKELDYELWIRTNGYSHLSEEQWDWLIDNFKELNEVPSVQPEQKTGRWVTQFDGTLHYCSECGWALMDTESGDLPYMGIDYHRSNEERWTCCPGWCEELMNYCPNCGAKMEEVK